jgi:hypothetical protein
MTERDGVDLLFSGAILLFVGFATGTIATYLSILSSNLAGALFGASIIGFSLGVVFWLLAFFRLRRDVRVGSGRPASPKDGLDVGVGASIALVVALIISIVGAFATGTLAVVAGSAGFAALAVVGLLFAGAFLRIGRDLADHVGSATTPGLRAMAFGSLLFTGGTLLLAVLTPFPAIPTTTASGLGTLVGGVIVLLSVIGPLLWVIGGYRFRAAYRSRSSTAAMAKVA